MQLRELEQYKFGNITFDGSSSTINTTTVTSFVEEHGSIKVNGSTGYALWAGGTATGAANQQVSGLGSSGNVLTSNGAGALPTWQASATSGTVTSVSGTANQVSVANGTTTPVISLIGPYTPATYTAHGVLIGEGTSSIAALGSGSAGQVLQSGGASADPAYSTATYPATASGTGTLLIADGTNWSATTSTYPNTNAINTLLYASSANVMSALATANSGVLVTDGSGVPSISSTLPSAVQGNITSTGTLGNQLNSTRCCFSAYLSSSVSNVTGDGTVYTIVYNGTVFDQGSNFNTSSGVFTAPVTGKYLFTVAVDSADNSAYTNCNLKVVTTARTYTPLANFNIGAVTGSASVSFNGSVLADMTANDTAKVTWTVSGSTKSIGVTGGADSNLLTYFQGYLLC